MESFKLLYEERNHFYLKNNIIPQDIDEKKLKAISKRYHLDGLYYGLDNHNHNLFKRIDRYRKKRVLIILFSLLVIFNSFEIIFHIVMLHVKKKSEDYNTRDRWATSLVSLINIFISLILSTITMIKLKIKSSIFY